MHLLRRTCATLLAGGLIISGTAVAANATPTHSAGSAVTHDAKPASFDWVKEHGRHTEITHSELGTIDVWAATLSTDSLSHSTTVLLYGQLRFPSTSSDIGFEEDSDHYPHEENWLLYNGGLKAWLRSSEEDPASLKYDRRIFRVAGISDDGSIIVRHGGNIELTIKNETFRIDHSPEAAVVNATELDEAIDEHWSEYTAAKSRGMVFVTETEERFTEKMEEARQLSMRVGQQDSGVSNEDVQRMREALNRSYDELLPAPFDRTALREAVMRADEVRSLNGNDGRRLTRASHAELMRHYVEGLQLLETPDLTTIKVPHEAPPVVTHEDFRKAAQSLQGALAALEYETYTPVDARALNDLIDTALLKTPSVGHGFSEASRAALFSAIEEAKDFDAIYDTDLQARIEALQHGIDQLEEITLDPDKRVRVTVRYKHDLSDAPSSLIKDYFTDDSGTPITHVFTDTANTELRIPLDDPMFKRFDGYHVLSVNYNGSTLDTHAAIHSLSTGERILVLRLAPLTSSSSASGTEGTASTRAIRVRRDTTDSARESVDESSLDVLYATGDEPTSSGTGDESTGPDGREAAESTPSPDGMDSSIDANEDSTDSEKQAHVGSAPQGLAATGASSVTVIALSAGILIAGALLTLLTQRRRV